MSFLFFCENESFGVSRFFLWDNVEELEVKWYNNLTAQASLAYRFILVS